VVFSQQKALEELLHNERPVQALLNLIDRTKPNHKSVDEWQVEVYNCWLDHYRTMRDFHFSPKTSEVFAYTGAIEYIYRYGKAQ